MARHYKNREKSKHKRNMKRTRSFHDDRRHVENKVTLRYRDPQTKLVVKTITYHDVELSAKDLQNLKNHKKMKCLKTTTDAGWHQIHWYLDTQAEDPSAELKSLKVLMPR